jgi:hypothetical protein
VSGLTFGHFQAKCPNVRPDTRTFKQVRLALSPEAMLLEFFDSTYAAAADLGRWDRQALERLDPRPPSARQIASP